MDSFLFALIAVFLTSMGGRDQLMVSRFSATLGQSNALLAVAAAVCAVTAITMAFAGSSIADLLPGPARKMLIAFALLAGAIELFWPVRMRQAKEPTRSLGAFSLVLALRQIGDAARFAVFAFAAATVLAPMAGLGGALGGAAAMYLGWSMGSDLERRLPLRTIRIALGLVMLGLAVVTGLSVRGLI